MFKGTRVPVRALICNLRHSTIEEFCEQFPTYRMVTSPLSNLMFAYSPSLEASAGS